ncbi:metallo-phosphoesterase [PinkBerry-associated phage LS06-2018-MD08]|nr:metallo-phosphoesterase [PinkBerry-associated phage LS06-2018-MD08]
MKLDNKKIYQIYNDNPHLTRQEKADICNLEFGTEYSESAFRKRYATYKTAVSDDRLWLLSEDKKPLDRVVGVFSDCHFPFVHENYLQFLTDTFVKWGVTDIVCTGDIVDNHAISRHQTETVAMGGLTEYQKAYDYIQEYVEVFPRLKLTLGNHDLIPQRQAATLNLGSNFIKSFSDIWDLPKEWEVGDSFVVNNVLYNHYGSGKDGAINRALTERMSTVTGHTHSWANVKYTANERDIIFGMNVGCGIDNEAYAFAYGKMARYKPNLSCGVVVSSNEAYIVPMGDKYFKSNQE